MPRTNLHDERLPTPTGNAFGAALVLRNLSRAIVELLHKPEDNPQDNAADTEAGLDGAGLRGRGMGKAGKEKKLRDGDMFGLPIPEGLMILGQGQGISRGGQSRRPTPSDGGMDVDEQPEELEEIHLPPEVLTQHEAERAKGALKGVEDLALDWAVRGDGLGEWMGEVSFISVCWAVYFLSGHIMLTDICDSPAFICPRLDLQCLLSSRCWSQLL